MASRELTDDEVAAMMTGCAKQSSARCACAVAAVARPRAIPPPRPCSMVGMGALSAVIAVPLAASARWMTWANSGLQVAVGLITVAIGVTTVFTTVFA
jgi:hypothetical protein